MVTVLRESSIATDLTTVVDSHVVVAKTLSQIGHNFKVKYSETMPLG